MLQKNSKTAVKKPAGKNRMAEVKMPVTPAPEPLQPQTLCDENQVTIFDNDATIAAAEFAQAVKESKLWKERLSSTKRKLIQVMKDGKYKTLRMGEDKVLKYKYTEAKDDLIMTDYKPKSRGRRFGGR